MEKSEKSSLTEPYYVLDKIKRGLSGYVSYLASCEMNESFSEYVLYEPVLRILTATQVYEVECEYPCPRIEQPKRGDKKRIDFKVTHNDFTFALEVKWVKENSDITSDVAKLSYCLEEGWRSFLCIFGRKSHIENFGAPEVFKENGRFVYADFVITKYGCRIYELTEPVHIQEDELLAEEGVTTNSEILTTVNE